MNSYIKPLSVLNSDSVSVTLISAVVIAALDVSIVLHSVAYISTFQLAV